MYHETIDLGEIDLANMSYRYLGDLMHYHNIQTYGFDADHTITKICNETKQFGIDYGISYDNSDTHYHNLLTNDHYQLAPSHQTIIIIIIISESYNIIYLVDVDGNTSWYNHNNFNTTFNNKDNNHKDTQCARMET